MLACSGLTEWVNPQPASSREAYAEGAPAKPSVPPEAIPPADAAPPTDPERAFDGHWLVIVASNRDAAERVPALDVLREHPELGAEPVTLSSSRFKNLMPCYAVTAALAAPEKSAAMALSKKLRALGVDHYVKHAGPYVGPSAALDAWCATELQKEVLQGDVRVAAEYDGAMWVPVPVSEEELRAAVAGSPPPVTTSPAFDAWYQPAMGRPASVAVGDRYRVVEVRSGRALMCTGGEVGVLTLGKPHFGALEQPGGLTAPACGEPAVFQKVVCDGEPFSAAVHGPWIAVPESSAIEPYQRFGVGEERVGGPPPALLDAARAAARDGTEWDVPGDAEVEGTSRTVSVTRWKGAGGDIAVVEAVRDVPPGICGGDVAKWYGVFALAGDALGAQVGSWVQRSAAEFRGVVDIGADGRPELLLDVFPARTEVVGLDGAALGARDVGYCDCPC
jgi:hypothetical protein